MWRRQRWRSRSKKPRSKRKMVFIALVVMFFFSVQSFIYVEKHLRPPLMHVAKMRIKQLATQAINTAISERIAQGTNFEKLIDWKTDQNGQISGFMLNYAEHMKIASETVGVVETILKNLEQVPEQIPVGQALNSAIIASFGPKVPVRFVPLGAVKIELNTRQKDAGINMILVEVYIRIVAEVSIIIPFDTDSEIVETEIPISYLLVVGDVPMYYYDNKGNPLGDTADKAPNIALPPITDRPTDSPPAPEDHPAPEPVSSSDSEKTKDPQ